MTHLAKYEDKPLGENSNENNQIWTLADTQVRTEIHNDLPRLLQYDEVLCVIIFSSPMDPHRATLH